MGGYARNSVRFLFYCYLHSCPRRYGAGDHTTLFPGVQWGGMTACTSIFVQSALNMTKTELDSHGKWRIFSKLGAGYSSSRGRGEVMNNAYACLPM